MTRRRTPHAAVAAASRAAHRYQSGPGGARLALRSAEAALAIEYQYEGRQDTDAPDTCEALRADWLERQHRY